MKAMFPELARKALDAAPDPMVIIDGTGVVHFANRQASAIFGYGRDEIVGHSIELLLPVGWHGLLHEDPHAQPRGAGVELPGRRKDATEFPVEISLSAVENEHGALTVVAIRDVTRRKHTEAELIATGEAADRARALATKAREAADRANRGKSRFLSTASHDLRQPLQTLELLNASLRRMPTSAAVAEAVAQQGEAIGTMSRLLNALLDISKLEAGAIRPEPVDFGVAGMFEELRRTFAASATAKGLRFEVEAREECAYSDPSLVEQALRNLVSNAVKYTERGGVTLRCAAAAGPRLRLEVIDTGIGIAQAQIQHICEEFFQIGVPTHSAREGYGLGLSIVQRIVTLLDLGLDVRSEPGKGSVFSLSVPTGGRHPNRARASPAELQTNGLPAGATRVLLVEDDKAVRDATRLLLSVEGYLVAAVATVSEAMQYAAEHGVDLLVTDYHLADGETGTAVISALRRVLGADLKAVLITGDTSKAVQELPRDPRMRITSKPVRAEELLRLMRALLTQ